MTQKEAKELTLELWRIVEIVSAWEPKETQ
jgi:hypothetical protein